MSKCTTKVLKSPYDLYLDKVCLQRFRVNNAQTKTVLKLNEIFNLETKNRIELTMRNNKALYLWQQMFPKTSRKHGIYLYGGVGSGKSMIMDLFMDCVPEHMKKKVHFHRFMTDFHRKTFEIDKSKRNFENIATQLIQTPFLFCIDEFQVTDIADALIVKQILDFLHRKGVYVFATSNTAPRELYRNGIQRESFLPAIDYLEQAFHVIELTTKEDLRCIAISKDDCYAYPQDAIALKKLETWLAKFSSGIERPRKEIETFWARKVVLQNVINDAVVLEFDYLCSQSFSTSDYFDLCSRYKAFAIIGIPKFRSYDKDKLRRLINFVDAVYELKREIFIMADTKLEDLFTEILGTNIESLIESRNNGLHKVIGRFNVGITLFYLKN